MKFYFVSSDTFAIKNDKNELINIAKDAVEANLGINFNGKSKARAAIFATEAEAVEWAKHGYDADNLNQHAVVELETALTEEELKKFPEITEAKKNAAIIEDAEGKVIKTIPSYAVPANNFTLVKVSFAHADSNAKDIIFSADHVAKATDADASKADDKAAKTSSALNFIKKLATPVLTIGATATAFWYSGQVPTAVAALAKLGLALPAASLATQIAVSAAVGLAAFGVGTVAWMAAKATFNYASAAWKKFNRTNKEKYVDDLAAETTAIKSLETEKLGLKEDSSFVVALDKLLADAAEPAFDDKGAFAKDEPKDGNRLFVAKWEHEQLDKVAVAKEEDRPALLAEVRQGPKPTPAK